ncbi:hypothetical protein E0K89_014205 [Aquicoccus sp. SCR17]|nr:hypothetical protein [Carideicomes alvinocaridis]
MAFADRAVGPLLALLTFLVILDEWGLGLVAPVLRCLAVGTLILLTPRVRLSRQLFVVVGAGLTAWLALTDPDWTDTVLRGIDTAAFIAGFYVALSTLREAAAESPSIQKGGAFLAGQPPPKRYLAMTLGGHLFALVLNYGAIVLLGSLAAASVQHDTDERIRDIRRRRMLLAIQRGFVSSLAWSPLAFSMAISTSLVEGASWGASALPGLVSGLTMMGIGWALDTIFKPRVSNPPPQRDPEGSWLLLSPLLVLMAILGTGVFVLHAATEVRIVGIVALLVPLVAVCWAAIQSRGAPAGEARLGARLTAFLRGLSEAEGQIVLLMMAGYIGTVGAPLLVPLVKSAGLHPEALPVWVVLVALVWVIPLCGQLGMNPILAVTLLAPLIPTPDQMGIAPAAVVIAITAGWTIAGATSPFTATTLLIGDFGRVEAHQVGWRWNGLFALVCGLVMSLWVVAYATIFG